MYTLHKSMSGTWYGSVTEDNVDAARVSALALARLVAELNDATPKAAAPTDAPSGPLTPKGAACLEYLRAHPKALHEEYAPLGHTQRTITWLVKNGFLRWNQATSDWTVL